MPLDLYYMIASTPCRSVMLLAKTLGLELNLKDVDVLKKEHLEPEFFERYVGNFVNVFIILIRKLGIFLRQQFSHNYWNNFII
jgi:hypothetical protein